MALAKEDGLIVDLVVSGMSRSEMRNLACRLDTRRVSAVMRFFRRLDLAPVSEPPADLAARTLQRIAEAR